MAKEQELKRVELKVSVNCCDGCRRKVLKALSIKGVLRTEVHPTAGRVAVVGDVDVERLVKRLARVGKIAEVIVQAPPETEKKRTHRGGDKDAKNEASPANEKMGGEHNAGKAARHGADDKGRQQEGTEASSAPRHGGADVKATMCYHRAEPPMAVPVHLPYYAVNCAMPPAPPCGIGSSSYYGTMPPPPPYYGIGGGYYGTPPPSCRRAPPVVRAQPTRFVDEDSLGDDDAAGCHVM